MDIPTTNTGTTESAKALENSSKLLANIGGAVLRYGLVDILLY